MLQGSPFGAELDAKLFLFLWDLRNVLVVFTTLLFSVSQVHSGGANLLSLSCPGIHVITMSSTSQHAAWTEATKELEGVIQE